MTFGHLPYSNPVTKEKLEELSIIGSEVFETTKRFSRWLNKPYLYFENDKPVALLDLPENIQKVIDEIGRIKYGVY
jgi:uncharacterized protein (DUF2384 family)